MMKLNFTMVFFLVLVFSFQVQADTPIELLKENCSSCHKTEVYTRKDRKVNSLKELSGQVSRCVSATGVAWFPEDQHAVIQFLNKRYYKFDAK